MAILYKRKQVWWAWFYDCHGKRVRVSTGQRDVSLARTAARELERERISSGERPTPFSVIEALAVAMASVERTGRSPATIKFYEAKAKPIVRLLGTMDVNALSLGDTEKYLEARRHGGVSDATIGKELGALRFALRRSKKHKVHGHPAFRGDAMELMPEGVIGTYHPRERALSLEEYRKLRSKLQPRRREYLDLYVGLGVRYSELTRITAADVVLDAPARVHVRGTKTEGANRTVPLRAELARILAARIASTPRGEPLLPVWTNMRRALHLACKAAEIAPVSPNDLRRSFATWLGEGGVPALVTASLLGHTNSTMVRTVYSRIGSTAQHDAISALPILGDESVASSVTLSVTNAVTPGGQDGLQDRETSVRDRSAMPTPRTKRGCSGRQQHAADAADDGSPVKQAASVVPRDGIEPPTRGFSIPCSTN